MQLEGTGLSSSIGTKNVMNIERLICALTQHNLLSFCNAICSTTEKPFFTHLLALTCAYCWGLSKMNYKYKVIV